MFKRIIAIVAMLGAGLAAAAAPATAPRDAMEVRGLDYTLRLHRGRCTSALVLQHIAPIYHHMMRVAVVSLDSGTTLEACWARMNTTLQIMDQNGRFKAFPVEVIDPGRRSPDV